MMKFMLNVAAIGPNMDDERQQDGLSTNLQCGRPNVE